MRLISRLIGRHSLILQQFYPFLLRYLQSHEKDKIVEIFAMIIESCHELVPPEEIKPIIEKIITNFITEYCNNKHITIGLNSIREILLRMPLALDEAQIEYLVNFRTFRNSSVVSAAKSLINFFRDVCPQLLPKKFRGRFTNEDGGDNKKEDMFFGKQKLNYDVDGIELLARHEGYDNVESLTTTRVLNDEDFRKIKILKMREALKHVTKDDPFKKKEEEASEPEDDASDVDDDDEGSESEVEFVSDEEEGEIELDEEIELDDEDGEEEIEEESKASDSSSEITEYEDMDVDSSDLENSSEEDNPHGFVYARTLDTFKKT
jgi:protein SDA1